MILVSADVTLLFLLLSSSESQPLPLPVSSRARLSCACLLLRQRALYFSHTIVSLAVSPLSSGHRRYDALALMLDIDEAFMFVSLVKRRDLPLPVVLDLLPVEQLDQSRLRCPGLGPQQAEEILPRQGIEHRRRPLLCQEIESAGHPWAFKNAGHSHLQAQRLEHTQGISLPLMLEQTEVTNPLRVALSMRFAAEF